MAKTIKNMKAYQRIDGELLNSEIKKKYGTRIAIANEIGCSHSMINDCIKRNAIAKVYLPIITELLDRPRDYFNAKEEIVAEVPSNNNISQTDVYLTLKKIEALLLSINRKLDGKPMATLKV